MAQITIDVDQLRALIETLVDEAIRASLAKAFETAPRFQQITAAVDSVDGSDAFVIPADDPANIVQATRMHPDIVAGSTVWLIQTPPAGAFVLGPIP